MTLTTRLEALYPVAPIWAQNVGITLFGVKWRQERLGGQFAEHVSGFLEREGWSEGSMAAHVRRELRRVLSLAFERVPHYREKWRGLGLTRTAIEGDGPQLLHTLPVTRKEELRVDPWAFVAEQYAANHRQVRSYLSSGSTGTPVTAICSAEGHRRFMAAREARSFRWAGASVRSPRSMIGGRMIVPPAQAGPPFHRYNAAERQIYFSAFHISPRNVGAYVDALNSFQPEVLTGYAVGHWLLARLMLEQGLRLSYRPTALVLSSEKLTGEMKKDLMAAFGARAFEEYGAVENCHLATECEEGRLHVSPDFGLVEILDEEDRPCPPGIPGRVVCTGLLNDVQPLVRYEIGDEAAWSREACSCGRRGLPVLEEVLGRTEDVILGPDGRRMVRFHGIFVGLKTVRQAQIVQRAGGEIAIRVVAAGALDAAESGEMTRRVRDRLGPVTVSVDLVEEIPRTAAGKYKAVVREIGERIP